MAYRMKATPMTLSDLQGQSLLQAFQMWFFFYSCAAVDKFSIDLARRAVPLR